MSEFGSLLREHYEEIAPPVDVNRLADRLLTEERLGTRPKRGFVVAMAAAAAVLLLVGGTTLLLISIHTDTAPIVDETPTTTIVDDTLPDTTVPVVPTPDQALPSALDVGYPYTILENDGEIGSRAAIVVAEDGIPLMAYMHHPAEPDGIPAMKVAACSDATCSAAGPVHTIAQALIPPGTVDEGSFATEVEMVLPDDGLPFIVWSEWEETESGSPGHLRAFKCADAHCSVGTLTELEPAGTAGLWAAIGPDNRPLIAQTSGEWLDMTIGLVKCGDADCAGPVERSSIEIPDHGYSTAVSVDGDSLPVIVAGLHDDEAGTSTLGLLRCTDPVCADVPNVLEIDVHVRELSAVAVDRADHPVILGAGPVDEMGGPDSLVLIACSDAACVGDPTVTVLKEPPPSGDMEPFGYLAIADDGAVTVAQMHGALNVMSCTDSACSGGSTDVAVVSELGWAQADLALTPDGRPAFAINPRTHLGALVCADTTCAASVVAPIPDVPGPDWASRIIAEADVQLSGLNPVIEIGPAGNPVIAYIETSEERGEEGQPIEVARLMICNDRACSDADVRAINDETYWVNMTLLPDGRPVVLYSDWSEDWETEYLRVAWCDDPACASWRVEELVSDTWMNSTTSIRARGDGSVVVVYQNGNYYVNTVSCPEGTCEGAEPIRVSSLVDPNDNEWGQRWWMSTVDVAFLPDGRPVIAAAQMNGELRYVECLDLACSESEMTVLDPLAGGATSAIDVSPEGKPLIVYYDSGELLAAACVDGACSEFTTTSIGITTEQACASVKPALAVGSNGRPLIAYWSPRSLMVAECTDWTCSTSAVDVFANVRTPDLAVFPDGSPALLHFAYSDVEPPAGQEMFGRLVDLRLAVCEEGTCVGN
jgi:hypothetical protein